MNNEELGKTIKAARKQKRLTQVELSLLTEISQAKLSKVEAGLQSITLEQFLRIAKILKIKISI